MEENVNELLGIKGQQTDDTVLNKGKSTEAESMITDYAESIRSWGQILAWVTLIFGVIGSIVIGGSSDAPELMLGSIMLGSIVAIINFVIILFITKLIWASIMIFVNISTTLKRMEITLNQLNHKS